MLFILKALRLIPYYWSLFQVTLSQQRCYSFKKEETIRLLWALIIAVYINFKDMHELPTITHCGHFQQK